VSSVVGGMAVDLAVDDAIIAILRRRGDEDDVLPFENAVRVRCGLRASDGCGLLGCAVRGHTIGVVRIVTRVLAGWFASRMAS
jgi:hypothetical protein